MFANVLADPLADADLGRTQDSKNQENVDITMTIK